MKNIPEKQKTYRAPQITIFTLFDKSVITASVGADYGKAPWVTNGFIDSDDIS